MKNTLIISTLLFSLATCGAITTGDGLVAAMATSRRAEFIATGTAPEAAGVRYAFLKDAGAPGAITLGTPGLAGRNVDGTTENGGVLRYTNAAAQGYVGALGVSSSRVGRFSVWDLLWLNTGLVVTTTTAQTVNSITFPSRDENGSTNGAGVDCGLYVSTATTNAAAIANTTMSYTNSAGTAGRTATIASFPATAVAGTVVPFLLAAGDAGVRSIQTITLGTSYVAGAVSAICWREIGTLDVTTANTSTTKAWQQLSLIRTYNGAALFFSVIPDGTTAYSATGEVIFIEG